MSIQMKNGCLVYYGNLIGYQAKNQTEVTVDPQFRREELESWLARRGLVPRWEEGVYERLSNEGFRVSDSSPELQSCRIWQLKPGTPIQMRFIGLDAMAQKFGGPTPEQYHVVYDGRIQDNDLEKLWNKFSRTPLGPDGQPLANITVGTTIIEYIRNILKRVRKKESNLIMASQNLEDFDREGIRELTKPLFAIPPHQFIFNCGSIDKRFYMDLLQLEEAEYNLIRFPQRGVCLFKCGNERYLLEVHAPAYKEALYGSAGGR